MRSILLAWVLVLSAMLCFPAAGGPTPADAARGYWLSTGNEVGKRPLPPSPRIDAPLGESRSVYIGINALRDFSQATLSVRLAGVPDGLVQTAWQRDGREFIAVAPFNGTTRVSIANGAEGRLWLTLLDSNHPADIKGSVHISLDGREAEIPLELKVWPVKVPADRPFGVRGYGGFQPMAGGTEVTAASMKQLEAMLGALEAIGGNVFDLTGTSWGSMDRNLKITGTGQSVRDWLSNHRKAYANRPARDWPRIDFSYYDPWFAAAKAHGLTRVNTHLPLAGPELQPLERQWQLLQLKAYLQTRGVGPFFCKISDEILPADIPAYITSAKVAQSAGWRPFTTISVRMAGTAENINRMNPYCDEWQVGIMSTQHFDELIHRKYLIETLKGTMPSRWRPYTKGGATNTFGQPLIPDVIAASPGEMEGIEVFQDGKSLSAGNRSPWGNKRPGMFFTSGTHLYVSPLPGTNLSRSTVTVKYERRVPSAAGHPLAKIDPTDEVWFYTGNSPTYAVPYEHAASVMLRALYGGYQGLGWYAFYKPWNTSKVVIYDNAAGHVEISPAYLGLKDGWHDARLLSWLVKEHKAPLERFLSQRADAPLRLGEVTLKEHTWQEIVNLGDPFVLNDTRRQMLEAAR